MGKRILAGIMAALALALGISANAMEKATDHADLSSYISTCEQFGSYKELAEALLCAASIPYGKSPEDCIAELQSKGFRFEYEIYAALPNDVTTFDVTYNDAGTPVLPMMREVSMVFSPTVSLYMRTESSPVPLKSTADEYGMQGVELWEPIEEPPEGEVASAHLQFFDENSQEWITWTFMSPEGYKAE